MIVFLRPFRFKLWLLLVFLLIGLFIFHLQIDSTANAEVSEQTVVLQPGSEGIDSYVCMTYGTNPAECIDPSNNHGSEEKLYVGFGAEPVFLSYIKFDLSSIPTDASISAATLNLYVAEEGEGSIFYGLAQTEWQETTLNWSNKPAISNIGTISLTQNSWTTVNLVTEVRNWLNSSATNFGLGFDFGENDIPAAFYSSDYSTAGYRPKLTVTYTANVDPVDDSPLPDDNPTDDNINPLATTDPDDPSDNSTGQTGQNSSRSNSQTGVNQQNSATTGETIGNQALTEEDRALENSEKQAAENNALPENFIQKIIKFSDRFSAPTILLISGLLLSLISTIAILPEILGIGLSFKELMLFLTSMFFSLFSANKNVKLGVVYDETTKKPIGGVLIMLYRFPEIKLIATRISNKKGEFYFGVDEGEYTLSAIKKGFTFPSLIYKSHHKEKNPDDYIGQTLKFLEKSVINPKIPLDPTPKAVSKRSFGNLLLLSQTVRMTIIFVGTTITIFSLLYHPTISNYLLINCYLILWVIEFISQSRQVRFSKIINSKTNRPVELALLRIYSDDGKILETFVSNHKGQVMPYLHKRHCRVVVERMDYHKLEKIYLKTGFLEHEHFELKPLK
jgi:hypothetical protein